MANNRIQIKRSTTTAITNTTPSINAGELVFSSNGYILAIGDPANSANVISIGGARFPGVLTANQALVANSTSGIDKIVTANLTLSGASVNAINSVANLTNLGSAGNNELTTTWAIKTFVDAKIAQASNPQGSNGEFQYNNSGVLAGTNNMVYDNTTGQITVGNSTVNVQIGYTGSINALAHFHGQQNGYVQVIMQNSNSGTRASSDYVAENDLGSETQNYVDLGINSSNYNDPAFSAMGAGDSYLYAANNDLVIGTADAGELKFITGGTTSGQIRAIIDAGGNVGIGNTTPDATLKVTGTANISGLTTISANLVLGSGLTANGTGGSDGQVLTSNGSTVYWRSPSAGVSGTNTQVQFNDSGALGSDAGLTFNKDTDLLTTGKLSVANTTASTNTTTGALTVAGGVGVSGRINVTDVAVGNDSVYATINNSVIGTNNLFATGTVNGSVLSVGGWVIANNSGVFTSGVVNGDIIRVGSFFSANTTQVNISQGIKLSANGALGSANQVLRSDSSGVAYWADDLGDISSVSAGNGLTGGGTSGDVTLTVLAGTDGGLSVNSTGVWISAGSGLLTNASGLHVGSGSGISVAADSVSVLANNSSGLVANSTGVHIKTGSGLGFDGSGNLQVTGALSVSEITVSGNLTVLGDLVSLNVSTLAVEDSIITLAKDQSNTGSFIDAVDIGFFGTYGSTSNSFISGLFRDQSDSGLWKLFTSNGTYTNSSIDTANNAAFKLATLQTYLNSGGLIANAESVYITANSTVNVNISANVLSLSGRANNDLLFTDGAGGVTGLALGTSGYVVQSNGTAIVYDTLDGGTF